ncbi:hypothetical protein ACFQ46_10775 [Kineococcus sp. GCM10028916]|uniref:hypothetical protein n=1 Tax=Kineococcus sp. GCM10028916 TaxID=3273394 RepID=UPI00362E219A
MTSSETGAVRRRAVTLPRVLHAEWTKLASLAWPVWVVVGTVAAAGSLAFVLGLFVGPGDAVTGTSLATTGNLPALLGVLVLGVLVGTGDFATGTSLVVFAAVPRRLPVLAAQVVVVAVVSLVTAVAALAVSVLATTPARAGAGVSWELTDPATRHAAVGYVLFLTGVGVLGVGLGVLLRRPPAALTSGVLLFVVVDQVLAANPGRVTDAVRALLPAGATRLFADGAGGGPVLATWCAAVVLLAGFRLVRRDVT